MRFWERMMNRHALLIDDGSFYNGGDEGDDVVDDEGDDDLFLEDESLEDEDEDVQPSENMVPQSELDRIIGERLARERSKYSDYDQLKSTVGSLQNLGIDINGLVQEAQRRQLEAQADELDMSPQAVNLINSLQTKLQTMELAETERKIQAEVDALSAKYPDFAQNQDSVFQLALEKRLSLEDAYVLATHPSRVEQAKVAGEQSALANLINRETKKVNASGESGAATKLDIANMPSDKFEELKQRALKGERIAF